jgi:hypothetical protein
VEVGRSISKAVADRLGGDMDSAMLHACNAVDGTAKKIYPTLGVGARFKKLLRDNYASILEPMMPGINLEETVFPISMADASGPGGRPDVATILYAIHRCAHGHGDALPVGYELIPDTTTDLAICGIPSRCWFLWVLAVPGRPDWPGDEGLAEQAVGPCPFPVRVRRMQPGTYDRSCVTRQGSVQ